MNFCGDSGDEEALLEGNVDSFCAKATSFVKAYEDEGGPVPYNEFDLLIPFMRSVCLIDTLFAFGAFLKGEVWNPAHAKYHLNNLISMQTLKGVRLFN